MKKFAFAFGFAAVLGASVTVVNAEDMKYRDETFTVTQKVPERFIGAYDQRGGMWGWKFNLKPDGTGMYWVQTLQAGSLNKYEYADKGKSDIRWGVATKNGEILYVDQALNNNGRMETVKAMMFIYRAEKDGKVYRDYMTDWKGSPIIGGAVKQ